MHAFPTEVKIQQEPESQKFQSQYEKGPFLLTRTIQGKNQLYPKSGEWTLPENAKYAAFIQLNAEKMEGKPHGKLWTHHQEMAKFIKSRNFRQCKSHHQKMITDQGSIARVISHLIASNSQFETILIEEREKLDVFLEQEHGKKREQVQTLTIGQKKELKDMSQDQVPTDDKYEPEIPQRQPSKKNFNKFSQFPSLGMQGPSMISEINRDSKWRQCHNLFLQWTSRLNELMMPPQRM